MDSDSGPSGIHGPDIQLGSMAFVRKGAAGILVVFGGYDTSHRGTEFKNFDWDRRPTDQIFIYDIQTNVWYLQEATGDIPSPRTDACVGVSAAPDDSSFQITMHGGWDLFDGTPIAETHILSLPSFTWIRVDARNDPDQSLDSSIGRLAHKCDVWNDRQMIATGGSVRDGTKELNTQCNDTYPPFKVLDTSLLVWRNSFDPTLEYTVPDVVSAIIGGNGQGGATLQEPSKSWSSNNLKSIFGQTVARDTFGKGSSVSFGAIPTVTVNATPTPTPRTLSVKLSGGAIADIVIGALAVVAAAIATFWWHRRRSSARLAASPGSTALTGKNALQTPAVQLPQWVTSVKGGGGVQQGSEAHRDRKIPHCYVNGTNAK
ncbi:cell wall anchored protein [Seiridium cupressi]